MIDFGVQKTELQSSQSISDQLSGRSVQSVGTCCQSVLPNVGDKIGFQRARLPAEGEYPVVLSAMVIPQKSSDARDCSVPSVRPPPLATELQCSK